MLLSQPKYVFAFTIISRRRGRRAIAILFHERQGFAGNLATEGCVMRIYLPLSTRNTPGWALSGKLFHSTGHCVFDVQLSVMKMWHVDATIACTAVLVIFRHRSQNSIAHLTTTGTMISSTGTWSLNELQWLNLVIGYWYSSPSNDHQGEMF